eukprot:jgi/Mesvir1/14889/Mv05494-RA.1
MDLLEELEREDAARRANGAGGKANAQPTQSNLPAKAPATKPSARDVGSASAPPDITARPREHASAGASRSSPFPPPPHVDKPSAGPRLNAHEVEGQCLVVRGGPDGKCVFLGMQESSLLSRVSDSGSANHPGLRPPQGPDGQGPWPGKSLLSQPMDELEQEVERMRFERAVRESAMEEAASSAREAALATNVDLSGGASGSGSNAKKSAARKKGKGGGKVSCGDGGGSNALWVDKYAPKSFVDLLSDEAVNRSVIRWLKSWDKCVFGSAQGAPRDGPGHNATHGGFIAKNGANGSSGSGGFKGDGSGKGFGSSGGAQAWKGKDGKATSWGGVRGGGGSKGGDDRPDQKILLLHGAPGLGKTTLAHIAARHCGYRPLEVNASDDRSANVLRLRIRDAVEMAPALGDGRPNCLIIDEIDGALGAGEGKGAIDALLAIVNGGGDGKGGGKGGGKGASTGDGGDDGGDDDGGDDDGDHDGDADAGYDDDAGGGDGGGGDKVRGQGGGRRGSGKKGPKSGGSSSSSSSSSRLRRPIICICNDAFAPALRGLRSAALVFKFPPTNTQKLVARLQAVCKAEGVRAEARALTALADVTDQDIRACLNTLQFLHARGRAGLPLNPKSSSSNTFTRAGGAAAGLGGSTTIQARDGRGNGSGPGAAAGGQMPVITVADVTSLALGHKDMTRDAFALWNTVFQSSVQVRGGKVVRREGAEGSCLTVTGGSGSHRGGSTGAASNSGGAGSARGGAGAGGSCLTENGRGARSGELRAFVVSPEALAEWTRVHSILSSSGEKELLIAGCHENLHSVRLADVAMSKSVRCLELLGDADLIFQKVHAGQAFHMLAYVPALAMAFRTLVAGPLAPPRLEWPRALNAAESRRRASSSLLESWMRQVAPSARVHLGGGGAVTMDVLSPLLSLLSPAHVKPLAPNLLGAAEQARLRGLVGTLIQHGLSYATAATVTTANGLGVFNIPAGGSSNYNPAGGAASSSGGFMDPGKAGWGAGSYGSNAAQGAAGGPAAAAGGVQGGPAAAMVAPFLDPPLNELATFEGRYWCDPPRVALSAPVRVMLAHEVELERIRLAAAVASSSNMDGVDVNAGTGARGGADVGGDHAGEGGGGGGGRNGSSKPPLGRDTASAGSQDYDDGPPVIDDAWIDEYEEDKARGFGEEDENERDKGGKEGGGGPPPPGDDMNWEPPPPPPDSPDGESARKRTKLAQGVGDTLRTSPRSHLAPQRVQGARPRKPNFLDMFKEANRRKGPGGRQQPAGGGMGRDGGVGKEGHGVAGNGDKAAAPLHCLLYKFHEGFTNAVRRPVKLRDLL